MHLIRPNVDVLETKCLGTNHITVCPTFVVNSRSHKLNTPQQGIMRWMNKRQNYWHISVTPCQTIPHNISQHCWLSICKPGQMIATLQCNISQHCWAQHIACIWSPCCHMLHVEKQNSAHALVQHCCTNPAKHTTSSCNIHIAIGWPSVRNIFGQECCDRLAGAWEDTIPQRSWQIEFHG